MKAYYDQDGITIYHGDNRGILPALEPDSVDLVLTDPPYGIRYHSGHYVGDNPHRPLVGDDAYPVNVLHECRQVASIAVLAFCRWDVLPSLPLPDSFIAWIKNNWTAGDLEHGYARQWEACAVYNGPNHVFENGRPADVVFCDRVPAGRMAHPTEKPVALMHKLLRPYPNKSVLDPYMGSGPVLVAAKLDGRKAIGIEIEEQYCEIAARRLGQRVFDWDTPQPASAPSTAPSG